MTSVIIKEYTEKSRLLANVDYYSPSSCHCRDTRDERRSVVVGLCSGIYKIIINFYN